MFETEFQIHNFPSSKTINFMLRQIIKIKTNKKIIILLAATIFIQKYLEKQIRKNVELQ